MRFFENKLALILVFMTCPLLFLPKINLVSVGNETAGLRIDDLILLFIGFCLMLAHFFSHKKLHQIEGWILLVTGFSLISFSANRVLVAFGFLHMDAKVFYTVRLLEYFMFFYIGTIASRYMQGRTVVRIFLVWNIFLMILQKLGLAGAVTVIGYDSDVSSRVQGIASFPSEMGLLLNLIFCYLIFDEKPSSLIRIFPSAFFRALFRKSYFYWMFGLFSVFVIFTGNRVSIVALLVCFLFRIKQDFSFRSASSLLVLAVIIPFLMVGMGFLIVKTAAIYDRSAGLLSVENLELATILWDKIDLTQNPVGNEVVSVGTYDASWWMRLHKWIHVLKTYMYNPLNYLQGLGPGFAWAALDGGLLRILVENGLIGCFFYWKFFSTIYKINPQMKWMSIAFFLNMIFFDAYLAYKTMSFFLFTAGIAYETRHQWPSMHDRILRPLRVGATVN
jgi:hypothetical protein